MAHWEGWPMVASKFVYCNRFMSLLTESLNFVELYSVFFVQRQLMYIWRAPFMFFVPAHIQKKWSYVFRKRPVQKPISRIKKAT